MGQLFLVNSASVSDLMQAFQINAKVAQGIFDRSPQSQEELIKIDGMSKGIVDQASIYMVLSFVSEDPTFSGDNSEGGASQNDEVITEAILNVTGVSETVVSKEYVQEQIRPLVCSMAELKEEMINLKVMISQRGDTGTFGPANSGGTEGDRSAQLNFQEL